MSENTVDAGTVGGIEGAGAGGMADGGADAGAGAVEQPVPAEGSQPPAQPSGHGQPEQAVDGQREAAQPSQDKSSVQSSKLTPDAIEVPKGLQVDDGLLNEFVNAANELGLSDPAKASRLLELHKKALEMQWEQYAKARKEWRDTAVKDLGENIDTVLSTISDGISTYAGETYDQFIEVMDMTGLGDHPAVIKTLYALTSRLKEGSFASGGRAAQQDIEPEKIFYGEE